MKIKLLAIVLFLYSSTQVKGQLMPELNKMADLTSGSYGNFDTYARSIGFTFTEKYNEDKKTIYQYTRDVENGYTVFTEVFTFRKWNETGLSNIIFTTTRVDLKAYFINQLSLNKYISVDCIVKEENNEVAFCYETSQFGARIVDKRKMYQAGMGNGYTIVVWKK